MKQQPVMRRAGRGQRYSAGFTLIELMVTVAVVAILASIAYPSYTDYLRRGQVQEAPRVLSDYRARLEQYYQDNRTYGTGTPCPLPNPPTGTYFQYICTGVDQTFSVVASPINTTGLLKGLSYAIDDQNNQTSSCTGCAWNFSNPQSTWILRKP